METKEILGGIQQFAPLADLAIPGLGTGVSTAANLINMFIPEPTRYKTLAENNSLAYGGKMKYAAGGSMDKLMAGIRKLNPNLPADIIQKIAKKANGGPLDPPSPSLLNWVDPQNTLSRMTAAAGQLSPKQYEAAYYSSPNFQDRTSGRYSDEDINRMKQTVLSTKRTTNKDERTVAYKGRYNVEPKKLKGNKTATDAHELSHMNDRNILADNPNQMVDILTKNQDQGNAAYLLNHLRSKLGDQDQLKKLDRDMALSPFHDLAPSEVRADIQALRYELSKAGIYNDLKDTPGNLTIDMLDKLPKKVKKEVIYKRLRENYSDEDLQHLLRTVASNDSRVQDGKTRAAKGGKLNSISSSTVEVDANNPSMTDSVELPNAFVDHNETISMAQGGKYVFSDDLKDPRTGLSFAKMDKRIARSDAKAEKAMGEFSDNTLKHNKETRERLAMMNDKMRMASGGNYYKNGGKMKYANGGTDPLLSGLQKIANPIFGMMERDPSVAVFFNNLPEGLDNPVLTPPIKYPSIKERSAAGEAGVNVRIPNNLVSPATQQPGGDNNRLNQMFYRDPSNTGQGAVRQGAGNGLDLSGIASNPLTYQLGELGAKALMLTRGYDKQPRYQVNSPISLRGYDPANALMQNQYALNKARRDISQLGTASDVLNNLQNVYSNVNRTNADIVSRYDTMNRQAQVDYENRMGQRQAQNIGLNMATDQIRQQDEAAYFNQIYDLLTSVGNYGRAKAGQDTNRQAAEYISQAYPDIANFMNLNFGKK